MGFFDFLFGKEDDYENPADSARPYLDQIPGVLNDAYGPYRQSGQKALGQLQGEYGSLLNGRQGLQEALGRLLSNPGDLYKQLGQGYEESPGYGFQRDQALGAIGGAAAAGGQGGSLQHQQQAGDLANNLANQDFGDYIKQILGLYGTGLEGTAKLYDRGLQGVEGLNNQGYEASNQYGTSLGNNLQSQANLEYAGTANQNSYNQSRSAGRRNLLGAGLGAGLGYAFGGPLGGVVGSRLGLYPKQNQANPYRGGT